MDATFLCPLPTFWLEKPMMIMAWLGSCVDRDTTHTKTDSMATDSSSPSSSSASSSMENAAYHKLIESSLTSLKIPKTHVTVGLANLIASNKDYRTLFVNRRLPNHGWSDIQIQHLLYTLAQLDTNQKKTVQATAAATSTSSSASVSSSRWCGVGEREGRVYSNLVASRHFGLSHGMGRSGDIAEAQPKAVGSTTLVRLTLILVLDAIRRGHDSSSSGLSAQHAAAHGILLPLCTGMSMSLLLSSLHSQHQATFPEKRLVLWSRIDQKSCFKAIESAGLQCIVIPTKLDGDAVVTDVSALEVAIHQHGGSTKILAVVTTTSCFAPRVPDQVDQVAKLLQRLNDEDAATTDTAAAAATTTTDHSNCPIYHVINNAYGLQSASTCHLINRACTIGRVDAIVCSTDKNFLVPVGGAVVLSPHARVVERVGQFYAGRASSSPIVDLFITLLSMGLHGYQQLLRNRCVLLETFAQEFNKIAIKHGERLLESCTSSAASNDDKDNNDNKSDKRHCHHRASNDISFGITLDGLARPQNANESNQDYKKAVQKDISSLGAMLFQRCVSGTRVIPRGEVKIMGGQEFVGFGSSHADYPHAYLTAACAIGLTRDEMDSFFLRLDKTLAEFHKKKERKQKSIGALETP
jgi:O-phospho-L-seryl-tRNASec:L-selenocysteinyl-tRNA synthase